MELELTLEQRDYAACQAFVKQSAGLSLSWLDFVAAAGLGAALVVIKRTTEIEFHFLSGLVTVGFIGVLTMFFLIRARSRLRPDPNGVLLGPHRYTTDDSGFHVSTPQYQTTYNWSAVRSWPETRDHLFIQLDRVAAIIVPKRAFSDASQQAQFIEELARRERSG